MGRKHESSALMIGKKLRIVKNMHQADSIIFPYLSVFFAAGTIWFTVKRFKKQKKRKQSKTCQFPRADDIEKERSKHFQKLQVDMNKVHLICNEEDWDEIFPHVSGSFWSNTTGTFVLRL